MTREELNTKKISNIRRAIEDSAHNLQNIPGMIETMIDKGFWKRYKIYTGEIIEHQHLYTFITGDPPRGWGMSPQKIEALIKDEPRVLTKWREAMKQQGKRGDFCNNVTEVKEAITGNTKAYTLARLEREAPELFERVCNKELSANAAAIKAGFRKTRTVYLSQNPAAAAKKIIEIAGAEYIAELVEHLKKQGQKHPKTIDDKRYEILPAKFHVK